MIRKLVGAIVLGIATLAASVPTYAQTAGDSAVVVEETRIDILVREVASDLRCVVCQGLSLQDSPSSLAQNMRAIIREQLEAGRTPEQVKQHFVESYGEFILLAPEPRGFNLAVYVLPILAVLIGALVIVIATRRWSSRGTPPAELEPHPESDPELEVWEA
jgi:cytochrome c-type biogenesis protein CcmH